MKQMVIKQKSQLTLGAFPNSFEGNKFADQNLFTGLVVPFPTLITFNHSFFAIIRKAANAIYWHLISFGFLGITVLEGKGVKCSFCMHSKKCALISS